MKQAGRLLCLALLLSFPGWAQSASSQAPKSRKPAKAGVHKMSRHAARQFSLREKREHSVIQAQQRRQAKLAKKQRKDAMRRSRRLHKVHAKTP